MPSSIIQSARRRAGFTQDVLAEMAGTSRPTLSAYEHGRKSPTLDTADRLLEAAGFALELTPLINWSKVLGARGQVHYVPDRLFRLSLEDAFGLVEAPLHLEWSAPAPLVDLSDPAQRGRWYEVVMREGSIQDIQRYIDGALLIDAWDEVVMPRKLRPPWQKVIDRSLGSVHA